MKYGKRRMILLFNLVIIATSIMSIYKNWTLMVVARGLFSFAAGAIVSFTPKIIAETIPAHLVDKGFGASTNVFINVSIMYIMFLGMGYPPEKSIAITTTNFWKVFYLSPIPLAVIAMIMGLCCHR